MIRRLESGWVSLKRWTGKAATGRSVYKAGLMSCIEITDRVSSADVDVPSSTRTTSPTWLCFLSTAHCPPPAMLTVPGRMHSIKLLEISLLGLNITEIDWFKRQTATCTHTGTGNQLEESLSLLSRFVAYRIQKNIEYLGGLSLSPPPFGMRKICSSSCI